MKRQTKRLLIGLTVKYTKAKNTNGANARRKKAARRKMSAMIPNIPKRKQLTRIKLEAIQLPNNDTTKTIAIKPFQLLHIRNSFVACSKNLLLNPIFT